MRNPGIQYFRRITPTTNSMSSLVSSATFQSDPDWRQKIAKKQDASKPFEAVYWDELNLSDSMQAVRRYKGETVWTRHYWQGPGAFTLASEDNLEVTACRDRALKKIKKSLRDAAPRANAVVPIAELSDFYKVLTAISNASNGMVKAMINLRKNYKVNSAANIVDAATDIWLASMFGMAPLASDLDNISTVISNKLQEGVYLRFREYSGTVYQSSTGMGMSGTWGPYNEYRCCADFVRFGCQYCMGVYYDVASCQSYDDLSSRLGLTGFANTLSTVWELVPYTWVVDYLSTVGDYLEDVFYTDTGKVIYCNRSDKWRHNLTFTAELRPVPSSYWYGTIIKSGMLHTCRKVHFTRTVMPSLPTRSLRFKTPREIRGDLDSALSKLANLGSVLWQGRRRTTKNL